LRSLERAGHQREVIGKHADAGPRLVYVAADLTREEGWDEAVRGCRYVLHTASPFPSFTPKDEMELIRPAVEGTRRVLAAAARTGTRRVVLTSSMAAIEGGQDKTGKVLDESDWTDVTTAGAYQKSKTLAERAAWDFISSPESGRRLELAVINPSYVQGPVLDEEYQGTSLEMVVRLLSGKAPGCARLNYGIVDVRDVASAHLAAMTTPDAAGKRFCCTAGSLWMHDMALILDRHFRSRGFRIPTNKIPDFMVRLVGLFDPTARDVVKSLGSTRQVNTERIRQVLGWDTFPLETTIVEMAESLIELGIVKPKKS
jgi:nucleoside-diphosphate-sugar epimerase